MERYLPTGNEMISLPKLNEQTAAIEDLTFLSMQQRGMIELCGTENVPLMQPFIQIDQEELALTGLQWSREHFWIPVRAERNRSLCHGQADSFDTGWRARLRGPHCLAHAQRQIVVLQLRCCAVCGAKVFIASTRIKN